MGAHNSVVGADQGFRAPSWDQESVHDAVHEDSASARIATGQRPRPSFRHPHATIRLRAASSTPEELLIWAAQWPERRWGVEGARGLGQLLAQQLVAAGEHVTDVPATLSARVRTLETGHGPKTDRIDARAVALVAAQRPDLPRVGADDHCRVLRLLADRRDELTSERRRTINRLHRHLRDLIAGGAPTQLSTKTAAALLAKVRPRDGVEAERKQMARDLLIDVRRLDRALAQNRQRCAAAVAASGTTLTQLAGISDVLAAKILGHIGDIGRFPSADRLASYAGTAPIEASSGDVVRHRLSRHGNRQLNHAIHLDAPLAAIRKSLRPSLSARPQRPEPRRAQPTASHRAHRLTRHPAAATSCATPSIQEHRQRSTQLSHRRPRLSQDSQRPPRRPHPDHPPRPRTRLLPAPTRHRQQPQRSPPTPQTTTHQNHLPHPPRRRRPHPPKRRDLT